MGTASTADAKRPVHGSKWIESGRCWNVHESATLLWQVGARKYEAKLLARKVPREATTPRCPGRKTGDRKAVGHDYGGTTGLGLWQITTGYNDDLIRRFGGRRGMFNPRQNARAALAILRRQGIGAWYAPTYGGRVRILRHRTRK